MEALSRVAGVRSKVGIALLVGGAAVFGVAAMPEEASAQGSCIHIPGLIECPTPPPGPAPSPSPSPSPAPQAPGGPAASSECADERKAGRRFVGLVSEDVFAGDADYRRATLAAQAKSHVTLLRQTFNWAEIERSPGQYSLDVYDDYVATLASEGIAVLPILFNPPRFHSSKPRRGAKRGTYPPRSYAAMGSFAAMLVERYGPNGSLWRERPKVPRVPICAWQVWNEPNIRVYWPAGPNARRYARMLKTVGRYIKDVDPSAEVVTGGIPDSDLGIPYVDYIKQLYRAGAGSALDTIAVHPYAIGASKLISNVRRVRKTMNRYGDRDGGIWVTEIGWATSGPRTRFTFSQGGQASRIEGAITGLWARQETLGLRGVVYFSWRDLPPYPGRSDFWGYHTGLHTRDGSPKAGYHAFVRAAARVR